MSICILCKRQIPHNRFNSQHKNIKYCSDKCNKRAYYIRNLSSNKKSIFKNKKEWLHTETGKGFYWEQFATNLLNGQWQGFGAPFDILWKEKKVDVKSCSLYKRKNKRGKPVNINIQSGWFSFHKHSKKGVKNGVDYLFCIGLIKNIPYKMWLIPFNSVPKHFTITPNSSKKYNTFLFKI